jgi:hypothetical protein
MKGFLALLLFVAAAHADDIDAELDEYAGDARLFFVNFTSSLIQVNATPCLRSHLSCHRRCCSSCFILPFPRITKFELRLW